MAETLVENRICNACGAEVRKGALFCYHCGETVAPEISEPENHKPVSDARFQEEFVGENLKEAEKPAEKKTEVLEAGEIPVQKPDIFEEAKLKSAASMRGKSKSFQKIKIEEVVWEEPESAPNGWFILVALVLTLIAALILWLAIYVK